MRRTTDTLTKILRKLNFVSHFFNGFSEPDFNVKGFFDDKEFIEQIEFSSNIFVAPDIEPEITDHLQLLFPA